METLTLRTIAELAGAGIRVGDPSLPVGAINSDTRSLEAGELFLALRGEKFDGQAFVADAARAGAAGAIVSRDFQSAELPPAFALLAADDPLAAYQRLAGAYRRSLNLKVVGITGSNGKTSTKDFTAAVLGRRFRTLKTEGNFNNHIGVPRTLLRAGAGDEVAVVEIGMNHPGEIAPLAALAQPDVAIVTNIGEAHLEFMHTREAIAQEKGMLIEALAENGCVILPAADPFAERLAARTKARAMTVGIETGDVHVTSIERHLNGSRFTVHAEGRTAAGSISIPGEHMIVNGLLALAAGLALGVPLEDGVAGLAETTLTHGRLEFKTVGERVFLDDSYNANAESMVAALETLAQLPAKGRRVAVLGRMGELGAHAQAAHQRVGDAAARLGINLLICVGAEAMVIAEAAQAAGLHESSAVINVEQAAALLCRRTDPGDIILIKGSRAAAMERVLVAFQSQLSAPAL